MAGQSDRSEVSPGSFIVSLAVVPDKPADSVGES
ncbi:hypothetical protein SAMN05216489_06297 [Streptomyces sp. 3213]|nr:hypothetical protein SAMN05216489_06297 [Streptomyces sp. 3213] [Streptomyces sp. 3213.3]